jgi:hypothetical protein
MAESIKKIRLGAGIVETLLILKNLVAVRVSVGVTVGGDLVDVRLLGHVAVADRLARDLGVALLALLHQVADVASLLAGIWDRWYDFLNIFAKKFSKKICVFLTQNKV